MNCLQRKVKLSDQGKKPAIKPIYENVNFENIEVKLSLF